KGASATTIESAYVKSFEQWTDKTTHGAKFGLNIPQQ
ncbi:MAG: hypothetical protein RLZZ234_60, partial [Candidatus Parcubacteria bacterium]